jgi:hypothetical protein
MDGSAQRAGSRARGELVKGSLDQGSVVDAPGVAEFLTCALQHPLDIGLQGGDEAISPQAVFSTRARTRAIRSAADAPSIRHRRSPCGPVRSGSAGNPGARGRLRTHHGLVVVHAVAAIKLGEAGAHLRTGRRVFLECSPTRSARPLSGSRCVCVAVVALGCQRVPTNSPSPVQSPCPERRPDRPGPRELVSPVPLLLA